MLTVATEVVASERAVEGDGRAPPGHCTAHLTAAARTRGHGRCPEWVMRGTHGRRNLDRPGGAEGVPVAGVQKTTIHGPTVETVEANAGLRPHYAWAASAPIFHVDRCMVLVIWVCFHTFDGGLCPKKTGWVIVHEPSAKTPTAKRSLFRVPQLREPPKPRHALHTSHTLLCP